MPLKIDQVDMDLEVTPSPVERGGSSGGSSDLWRALRSSAFRESLRPLLVEIIGEELQRARKRYG